MQRFRAQKFRDVTQLQKNAITTFYRNQRCCSATSNENMKFLISSSSHPAVNISLNEMGRIILCQETPHHVVTFESFM